MRRRATQAGWPLILLIVGAGVVSAFQVGKAPAALDAVRADLALDLAAASWLLSAFAVVGALAGAAIGIAIDHAGARRMVLAGLLLQAVASAAGAMAPSATPLLATRAVEGLGFLTVTVAAPSLVVAVAQSAQLGRAIAVWGTFMPVGMTIVLLGAPLLPMLGWRGYWFGNAAILAVYALVLSAATRGIARRPAQGRIITDLRDVAMAGRPWLLALLMAAFGAGYFALIGFLPTILSERLQVSAVTASQLTALVVIVNAAGNLASGALLMRGWRRSHVLATGFAAMAICAAPVLADSLPPWPSYALCIVFSAISGLIPVALLDAAPRYAPRAGLVGATVGLVMQGNNFGLVLGPAAAGAIAVHTGGWPVAGLGVAALSLLAAGLALLTLTPSRATANGTGQ